MPNILIGVIIRPDGNVDPDPFYCGHDGVQFRKKHAELVKSNKDGSKFFQIGHPILIPLQNIPNNTEDHPDIVAATKKRDELAKAAAKPEAPKAEPKGKGGSKPKGEKPVNLDKEPAKPEAPKAE